MIRILLPVDGSPETDRALAYVAERHARGPVAVTLLYVHETPLHSHAVTLHQHQDWLEEFRTRRARDVLEASASRLREAGIEVETRDAKGPLYRTILREASRLGAKEIVLGVRPPPFGFRDLDRRKGLRRLVGDLPAYATVGS